MFALPMMLVPGTSGGGHPGFALTYRSTIADSTSQSTYTFNGVSIGPAYDDRYVIVCISYNDSDFGGGPATSLTNCKINTVTITKLASSYAELDNGLGSTGAAIYMGLVTSGTTADITFTDAQTLDGACISVYTVTGLTSATPVDATANDASRLVTDDLTVSEGGFVLVVASAVATITLTNATEDAENNYIGSHRHAVGSAFGLSASTRTVSMSEDNVQRDCMAAISML